MILVDASAWIEFLRDTGSEVCVAVDHLLDSDLAISDAVSMEVLAGRSEWCFVLTPKQPSQPGAVSAVAAAPTESRYWRVFDDIDPAARGRRSAMSLPTLGSMDEPLH